MSENRSMSSQRTVDERIARWLDQELPNRVPDRVFESAFARTIAMPQERRRWWSGGIGGGWRGRALLVVAALLATTLAVFGPGALRRKTENPPANLLVQLRDLGRIRLAVRPDHPQFQIGGQVATGFDTDVADELARRLGLRADVVIVDVSAMLNGSADAWDAALPSVPDWTVNTTDFAATAAYYYWPHRLIVAIDSTAAMLADVQRGPICAVAGDAGASWLSGTYGASSSPPITVSVLTVQSDAECLAALSSGAAIAAVTARLSDADLQARSDIRVIGGPGPEPRSVLVHRSNGAGSDSTDLLSAINDALAAMRVDGTLTRLSERRFGGADLSKP